MAVARRIVQGACLVLASFGCDSAAPSHGLTVSSTCIRIVVPTAPGTPSDIFSRVIASELSATEGWRMSVENKPGALQTIGMAEVLKQPTDGLSIYPMSVPTMAVPALLPQMGLRPDVCCGRLIIVSRCF